MGRKKLPDTGAGPRTLSVRWSDQHHVKYLQLGGSKWLRRRVQEEIDKEGTEKAAEKKKGCQ